MVTAMKIRVKNMASLSPFLIKNDTTTSKKDDIKNHKKIIEEVLDNLKCSLWLQHENILKIRKTKKCIMKSFWPLICCVK